MEDKRLIEDYLPIEAISAEASREKSVRKGHISTLHLWWARRPLVACRAAVYGALVPASRFVPPALRSLGEGGNNGSDEKKKSLGRANSAKFVKSLCLYPGSPSVIQEAQRHILEAHAERLTRELQASKSPSPQPSPSRGEGEAKGGARSAGEGVPAWVKEFGFTGDTVTVDDITAGRAPRPRVLDMFAGGGAIPLEALRLGCEAYALDLNPVAHIIQLCTLVYPQKYGKPDPSTKGMVGPKGPDGQATWGGLADEVRYWGNWVLKKVKAEIGDLYPPLPDTGWWERQTVGQAASPSLLEKKKSKYRLHDFTERGEHCGTGGGTGVPPVGQKEEHGQDASATIDDLHRLLWLLEHKPLKIPDFLNEAKPNIEQLRLVAQALAGPALKGLPAALRSAQAGGELPNVSTSAEQSALGKLLANWNAVMVGKAAVEDRRAGQQRLL